MTKRAKSSAEARRILQAAIAKYEFALANGRSEEGQILSADVLAHIQKWLDADRQALAGLETSVRQA